METSVEILAPASAVWKLLTDTSRWPEWGPSVSRVEFAEQYIGPGRCRVVFVVPLLAVPYMAVCRLAAIRIKRILEEENRSP